MMPQNEFSSKKSFSEKEQEAINLISEYRSSIDKKKSLKYLNQAANICNSLIKEDNILAYALKADILSNLAKESNLPSPPLSSTKSSCKKFFKLLCGSIAE